MRERDFREAERGRREDNIKTDLRELEYDPGDWIALAEDRGQWRGYVRALLNLWIRLKTIT